MFIPPRCPHPACPFHLSPPPRFFLPHGLYHPRCRNRPVPRFRCRRCAPTFSRQSFRADYRHKKPHLNADFLRLMVSCVGLRQAARVLQVARRTVEHRFSRLARHASEFHLNRLRGAALRGPFQLDELESFESNRCQPVTVPVLIERRTFFIVATAVGPLRRKGRLNPLQRRRRALHEARYGRRPSHSPTAVREVLTRLREVCPLPGRVQLESDPKPLYPRLGRALLGRSFPWVPLLCRRTARPREPSVPYQPHQRTPAALPGAPEAPHLVRVEAARVLAAPPGDRGTGVELLPGDHQLDAHHTGPGAGVGGAGVEAGGGAGMEAGLGSVQPRGCLKTR